MSWNKLFFTKFYVIKDVYLMKHYVEAEGKGDDEEGIPEEEEQEGLQHFVEHRDVHIVPKQAAGM
jgi:hypothetical protein